MLPVTFEVAGVLPPSTLNANLRLIGTPRETRHRWGLNGGAGVRVGGDRVALMAEARAFYFREFELRFTAPDAPDLVNVVLQGIDPIRFEPVIVNPEAGIIFRF